MRKIFPLTFFLMIAGLFSADAQNAPKISYAEYIELYRDIAVRKMKEYGIPASITLAQGLLESGSGNSNLARYANNHFGIKCHKEWSGDTYIQDDDAKDECFRKYKSAEESFNDHSYFLTSRPRYADLFKLDINDYRGWAHGLKKAGYATNPRYADMLIKIIEENELFLYDSESNRPIARRQPTLKPVPKREEQAVAVAGLKLLADNLKYVEVAEGNRPIYINNNVRLTFARNDDDIDKIADDLGIHSFQLIRYNDLNKHEPIREGQAIYVEPKKRKTSKHSHQVSQGETMREISQYYGIKLKLLYRWNQFSSGDEPMAGDIVKLKKNKSISN